MHFLLTVLCASLFLPLIYYLYIKISRLISLTMQYKMYAILDCSVAGITGPYPVWDMEAHV